MHYRMTALYGILNVQDPSREIDLPEYTTSCNSSHQAYLDVSKQYLRMIVDMIP